MGTLSILYSGIDGLGGFKLLLTLSTTVFIEWHEILSFRVARLRPPPRVFARVPYQDDAFAGEQSCRIRDNFSDKLALQRDDVFIPRKWSRSDLDK